MAKRYSVSLRVLVAAPPDTVWALMSNLHDIAKWNPSIATSNLVSGVNDTIGATREVITKNGTIVREKLVELDHARRILGYEVLSFPFPVVDQQNKIVVVPGDGGDLSYVTFCANFQTADNSLVGKVADLNGAAFVAAANALGHHLGADVHVVGVATPVLPEDGRCHLL